MYFRFYLHSRIIIQHCFTSLYSPLFLYLIVYNDVSHSVQINFLKYFMLFCLMKFLALLSRFLLLAKSSTDIQRITRRFVAEIQTAKYQKEKEDMEAKEEKEEKEKEFALLEILRIKKEEEDKINDIIQGQDSKQKKIGKEGDKIRKSSKADVKSDKKENRRKTKKLSKKEVEDEIIKQDETEEENAIALALTLIPPPVGYEKTILFLRTFREGRTIRAAKNVPLGNWISTYGTDPEFGTKRLHRILERSFQKAIRKISPIVFF